MSTTRRAAIATPSLPLFVADHLALDFINSEFGVAANHVECFNDDSQVIEWLRRAGVAVELPELPPPGQRGALLSAALALRESAHELLLSRKARRAGDPSALNRVLARGARIKSWFGKRHGRRNAYNGRRVARQEDILVPVAEAVAELLADADFALVRKCENPDCTLWFYDRTKSHQRRWCSMAVCGNRMKVAAFRARRRAK